MNQTTLFSQGENPSFTLLARLSPSLLDFWERPVKKIWEMQGHSRSNHRPERQKKGKTPLKTLTRPSHSGSPFLPILLPRCTTQQTVVFYPSVKYGSGLGQSWTPCNHDHTNRGKLPISEIDNRQEALEPPHCQEAGTSETTSVSKAMK